VGPVRVTPISGALFRRAALCAAYRMRQPISLFRRHRVVENLVPAARGADLFIVGLFLRQEDQVHLDYATLRSRLADSAPARGATHMSSELRPARRGRFYDCAEMGLCWSSEAKAEGRPGGGLPNSLATAARLTTWTSSSRSCPTLEVSESACSSTSKLGLVLPASSTISRCRLRFLQRLLRDAACFCSRSRRCDAGPVANQGVASSIAVRAESTCRWRVLEALHGE